MKKINKSKWLNRFRIKMKRNPTLAEKAFFDGLERWGIKFRFQSMCYSKSFQCIVDFLIKSDGLNLVVEIDGGYHTTKYQQEKDKRREDWLKKHRDYDMIRFTNDEVLGDIEKCGKELACYYINKIKKSESNNFRAFCAIMGLPMSAKPIVKLAPKQKPPLVLAEPFWDNEEQLF